MTSEMQLPELEATMDEAEHNKKLEETWQSLCIHGVSHMRKTPLIRVHPWLISVPSNFKTSGFGLWTSDSGQPHYLTTSQPPHLQTSKLRNYSCPKPS